jgi:hypothetical protein
MSAATPSDAAAAPPPTPSLRLVCIADTHGQHRSLVPAPGGGGGGELGDGQMALPPGDLLIHAGDIFLCPPDPAQRVATLAAFLPLLEDFNAWLGEVAPFYRHGAIVTAGNHDHWLEQMGAAAVQRVVTNARYVVDDVVDVGGVSLFVSPASVGRSCNRAFQGAAVPRPLARLFPRPYYDVVVTHSSHRWDAVVDALSVAVLGPAPVGAAAADGDAECCVAVPRCRLHVGGHDHHYHGVTYRSVRRLTAIEHERGCRGRRSHRTPRIAAAAPDGGGTVDGTAPPTEDDGTAPQQTPAAPWAPAFVRGTNVALDQALAAAESDRDKRFSRPHARKPCQWIPCVVGSVLTQRYQMQNAPIVVDLPVATPPWMATLPE